MTVGIFSRTFAGRTLEQITTQIALYGITRVQFTFANIGLKSIPANIDPTILRNTREAFARQRIEIAAISGTVNLTHPNEEERRKGLRQLSRIIANCSDLGTRYVTLCTGSFDPADKWRYHPRNDTEEAWHILRQSVDTVLQEAIEHDVILCVEPEVSNVVSSAAKARRLLDEVASSHLKIVIDGANLIRAGSPSDMNRIMDESFELLASDIVLAHAKDLDRNRETQEIAAGTGALDYDHYIKLLHSVGYTGPLVLHGLREDQVRQSVVFLNAKLSSL